MCSHIGSHSGDPIVCLLGILVIVLVMILIYEIIKVMQCCMNLSVSFGVLCVWLRICVVLLMEC